MCLYRVYFVLLVEYYFDLFQLNHAVSGKTELFENVNIDWNLISDDRIYDTVDYSDDDLDGIQVGPLGMFH